MNEPTCAAEKPNGLTITGRHGAIGMHTPTGEPSRRPCPQERTILQLVADSELNRTDIITIDARTSKTLVLVEQLHARLHDEATAERALSDKEQKDRADRKERAEWLKTGIEIAKFVFPFIGFAVGYGLSHWK
jgi:hypothetical protein